MSTPKRILDILLSITGLIIASPVMLLIALCIRIDSPGKIFFSQKRLGKNKTYFFIHKFRKFPDNWGTKGSGVTTQGDVRMTTVGAFLERTKLDELPQLWNILKGEMSFVGPRPESTRYEELFTGEYDALLNFTPGIFGPNQVAYRNESAMYPSNEDPDTFYRETLFQEKAKNDLNYFNKQTFLNDIGWIFKGTLGTIVGAFNVRQIGIRYGTFVLMDFILFQVTWLITHIIRFNGFEFRGANMIIYQTGLWLIPLIVLPIMIVGGCYRTPIRYFSFSDTIRITVLASLGWLISFSISTIFLTRNFSTIIVVLSLLIFLCFLIFPRVWRREKWLSSHSLEQINLKPILIIGAGKKGSALSSFIERGLSNSKVIGFLDQDENLIGRYINGYKVFSGVEKIDTVYQRHPFHEIWMSESLNTEKLNRNIIDWSEKQSIPIKFFDEL